MKSFLKILSLSVFMVFFTIVYGQNQTLTYEIHQMDSVPFLVDSEYKMIDGDTMNQIGQNGLPQGEWEHQYITGNFKCRGNYKDGRKDGYWEKKYPNGNWQYQINLKNGYLDGPCKFYYSSGQLQEEGNFRRGFEHGNFKYYRKNGQLSKEVVFRSGLIMEQGRNLKNNKIGMALLDTDTSKKGNYRIPGIAKRGRHAYVRDNLFIDGDYVSTDSIGRFVFYTDKLGEKVEVNTFWYGKKMVKIKDTILLEITFHRPPFWKRKRRTTVCGFCFAGDTEISMADGSFKKIKNIKKGDVVLSMNFRSMKPEADTVLGLESVYHDNLIEISLENRKKIISTTDHPFYNSDNRLISYDPEFSYRNYGIECEKLDEESICQMLVAGKIEKISIEEIIVLKKGKMTYNISRLSKNSTYFVNGILVSNENMEDSSSGLGGSSHIYSNGDL